MEPPNKKTANKSRQGFSENGIPTKIKTI